MGDSEVREGANAVEVMGEVKGVIGQDVQITGSGHLGQVTEDCSLVTGVHGVTGSRSHLGAHCPATPQSWMGRLPAARSSSPATSRPQSGKGVGRRGIWFCPKGLPSSLKP